MLIYRAAGCIVGNSPGSRENKIYSPGNDKLTEVQLYMSTSGQQGCREIRTFSDVEKPFSFSDLAISAVKS